jgi:D-glycero-D-manno-heptose 1,7-bisphosphate phosphatase
LNTLNTDYILPTQILDDSQSKVFNKAIFLDRDGVLNHDKVDYVYTIEAFKIFDGVAEALQLLKSLGYKLIIITNQSGIAKGIYQQKNVHECFDYLQAQTGNWIDAMYFCPHHPKFDTVCECRKPGHKMITDALLEYNIDPAQSYMIGDAQRDITAGNNAGVTTIHINNGKENAENANFTANNLLEAAKLIARFNPKTLNDLIPNALLN